MHLAPTTIISDPDEVRSRLAALGLRLDLLEEVRLAWAAAEAGASPFEPITAPGTKGWIAGTGVLREALSLEGWAPQDVRNLPLSVHPAKTHSVSATSGDERTGIPNLTPTTKNPKGVVVADAVAVNMELDFGEAFRRQEIRQARRATSAPKMYLMLVTSTEDELRAEVSKPSKIARKQIVAWSERIILPTISRHPEPMAPQRGADLDHGQEIDVPVARR